MDKKIRQWMIQKARPLEWLRYQYLFEDGSKDAYLEALGSYQNPDGGFGHGLEPDAWNPESTPIKVWFAIGMIDELELKSNHPMIQSMIRYLTNTTAFENGFWKSTIPSNNDFPRAPWWTYQEGKDVFGYNPTATLAGFIVRHTKKGISEHVFGLDITNRAIAHFMQMEKADMHEIRCFIDLYLQIKDVIDVAELKKKIIQMIDQMIERDPKKWFVEYCANPLSFIENKEMPGYDEFKELVTLEASMINDFKNEEGVWDISWTWGQYEEAFSVAKNWWRGILVINYLKIMKEFDVKT